ncbi:MAG: PQQ-dependent sugar dehydrogenase [Flavobacterium sp.]|nr:MAG: PQQ-dependent sugar dehydrogenase [Flavobacterium sp.]
MKNLFTLLLFATLSACAQKTAKEPQAVADTAGKPVETEKPNSTYKPAFTGQTRIAGVKTTTPIESKIITDKLQRPWDIVTMPDGRFLVTQKSGTLRIVSAKGELSEPITGLPKVDDDGQGGLLGLALDPDFKSSRVIYWTFSQPNPKGNLTAVGKGRLSDDEKRIENPTVIFRAIPVYDGDKHFGSRIVFDKDGNLFVSTGERSDLETRPQAQQLNSALGKILHITKDGKPVDKNLFGGNALPEIYSYGHRNVQGLAIHPKTGDLWNSEMGPMGGDEINIIKPGKNYGWPTITYGLEYSGKKVGQGITQKTGLEQPVYYWDPVLSPSGMTFYSGNQIPEWENNLFICGLSSTHICRLVIENNKVVGEERLLKAERQRFRDITQGNDGALYAVTDDGRLYRIGKK